jgi:hypothetical protein
MRVFVFNELKAILSAVTPAFFPSEFIFRCGNDVGIAEENRGRESFLHQRLYYGARTWGTTGVEKNARFFP